MKKDKESFARNFNRHFRNSHEDGAVSEALGADIMKLVGMVVGTSKISRRPKESLEIVKSDIVFGMLETFNKLLELPRQTLINPYGYFKNSATNMLSTILLQRFSSVSTKDVLGTSIISRGNNRVYNRAKIISLDDLYGKV